MNSDMAASLVLGLGVSALSLLVLCADLVPDGVRWVWRRITGRAPGYQ